MTWNKNGRWTTPELQGNPGQSGVAVIVGATGAQKSVEPQQELSVCLETCVGLRYSPILQRTAAMTAGTSAAPFSFLSSRQQQPFVVTQVGVQIRN